jgi:hypothetical protein
MSSGGQPGQAATTTSDGRPKSVAAALLAGGAVEGGHARGGSVGSMLGGALSTTALGAGAHRRLGSQAAGALTAQSEGQAYAPVRALDLDRWDDDDLDLREIVERLDHYREDVERGLGNAHEDSR